MDFVEHDLKALMETMRSKKQVKYIFNTPVILFFKSKLFKSLNVIQFKSLVVIIVFKMIKFVGISAWRSKVLDAAAAERHRVPARQLDLTQVRLMSH